MEFLKYQHIERLGTEETDGILDGSCYVFPKIDGTNGQIFLDNDGEVAAGSRNRVLSEGSDNHGFYSYVKSCGKFLRFLTDYPNLRLYGEFLVPHSLKTYREDAWRKFYVFDVMREDGSYMSFDVYKPLLMAYDIDFIPPIAVVIEPPEEKLYKMLDSNTFLIEDNKGAGEGIVIKRYGFTNKYGRTTWAKIVRNDFKEQHAKVWDTPVREYGSVEGRIVEKYITEAFVEKTRAKVADGNAWNPSLIGALLGRAYNEMLSEEITHIVKEFGAPTIDFKQLHRKAISRIKELARI